MKDIPRVGFICTGEDALELSGAICCAGRLMRHFTDFGYMTGGCYSCICPSKQAKAVRERICHMCACNDVVITIGCDGFGEGDIMPELVSSLSHRDLPYFSCKLASDIYCDTTDGKSHKCFPSRSTAGIYSSCLVLCVSSDVSSALGKLSSMMDSINFAVRNTAKKAPSKSLNLEDLIDDFYLESSFHD